MFEERPKKTWEQYQIDIPNNDLNGVQLIKGIFNQTAWPFIGFKPIPVVTDPRCSTLQPLCSRPTAFHVATDLLRRNERIHEQTDECEKNPPETG